MNISALQFQPLEEMEEATMPILLVANFLGMARFYSISKGKIINSFFYYFRLAIILAVYIIVLVLREILKTPLTSSGSIPTIVEVMDFYGRIPVTLMTMAILNISNWRLLEFYKGISNVNSQFVKMGFKLRYNNYRSQVRIMLFLVLVKLVLQQLAFAFGRFDYSTLVHYAVDNINFVLLHLTNMIWASTVLLLKENFAFLNDVLRTLMYRQCWVIDDYVKIERPPIVNLLKRCAKLYDRLITLSKTLNSVFAWILIMNIPMIFVEIIYNTFSICQMAQGLKSLNAQTIIFDLLYLISFLEITIPCIYVKEEADKFVGRLNKVDLNLENSIELDNLMSNLTLQIYHQKIGLSAHGIFPMDGTLVYSFFGAITTYLVILLQFDH
ncbi:PREDICTED: putative gustatory receptor 28b [Nicrophorus vespilloides]|uniref:Gustatory receptor n=1 Tax=Nicrophorus vespilloides TaxID=110193 RepID=A0ABM1MJ96_NICVS|nr:PREDICTED: putative gustatory receptor 28b [Nicrophorus vespilloides]